MEKKALFKWIVLLFILACLFSGCSKKDKAIKTIQGDPEILYRQGLTLFNKRNYSDALKKFEELKSSFPDSPPYTLWAELKIGDCHFQKKDYAEAIGAYEEFRKIHPTHEEIPYVYYQIGMSHFNQIRTPDRDQTSTKKALSSFEYLVANYPPNLFTEKAKDKIEVCKKHLADNEFEIAKFYYQEGKFQIAIIRFLALLEKFPKISGKDKTLFFLGMSYLGNDQKEKAKEAFTKIVNEYPQSPHTKESRAILNRDLKKPERKILFVKIKAKETKKKERMKETEAERSTLVKFEDERRQPVPLEQEKKGEFRKVEERKVSLPMTGETVQAAPPREEAKGEDKKEAKEGTQGKTEIQPQIALKPEETKRPDEGLRIAMLPEEESRKAIPPKIEPGFEVKPKEERQTLAIPTPSIKSKKEEKPTKDLLLESESVKGMDTGQPIDITSDRVETYSKENLVVFKGNVMARQRDVVIYADRLEAVIIEDGKGIERVIANGNVKIQQGLRAATCQKAVFYNLDQKAVLTGDPKVWEGENTVSGDEIVFDIKQDRVEVKGGQGEGGKARIFPGEKIEKPK